MSDSVKKWHEMQEEEKYKNDKKMVNKKLITEELIDERLEARGVRFDIEHDEALRVIQKHYDFQLTDNWNNTPDYSIYCETTADGYEVWVATSGDGRNICINEDVYYYESDLGDVLYQAITDGYNDMIYVDDIDSQYVEDGIMQAWEDYINDMIQEVEDELIEEGYTKDEEE
jgi:hypothetical protein